MPYSPSAIADSTGLAPGTTPWCGTDDGSANVFARVLYGGRLPFLVGVGTELAVTVIAAAMPGMLAGFLGGWVAQALSTLMSIWSTRLIRRR